MSRSVRVSIAGFDFSVRTDAKPAYVRELAGHVESRMLAAKGKSRAMNTQTQAMLAAMSIADDYAQLQEDQKELKKEIRKRSERILATLEREAKS
ncbi:MAG: cell division protein ZapA [Kofleriaceae bacterium]|nr:cell division protein ZapA [Kofleriaceae bacterium]